MLSAAFIFEDGNLTEEFFALDRLIEEAAEANPGFVGKESWLSPDGTRRNSTYYWKDKASLAEFSRHPKHLEAKKRYREWYKGFHVVISEITKSYGDDTLGHLTPNNRSRHVDGQ